MLMLRMILEMASVTSSYPQRSSQIVYTLAIKMVPVYSRLQVVSMKKGLMSERKRFSQAASK